MEFTSTLNIAVPTHLDNVIINCTINNSSANPCIKATADLVLTNVVMFGNRRLDYSSSPCIEVSNANMTLDGVAIDGCGKGMWDKGTIEFLDGGFFHMDNSYITDGYGFYGGIRVGRSQSVFVNNSVFLDNASSMNAPCIYAHAIDDFTVVNTLFQNNTGDISYSYGAQIQLDRVAQAEIEYCTFLNNVADNVTVLCGGGMCDSSIFTNNNVGPETMHVLNF